MSTDRETDDLRSTRAVALTGCFLWSLTLGFLTGPLRWEVAHTYSHWVEGANGELPGLTLSVALPVLGLGEGGAAELAMRWLFWGFLWLGAVVIGWRVWTATSRTAVLEAIVLGTAVYGPFVILSFTLLGLGLWLPFGLL